MTDIYAEPEWLSRKDAEHGEWVVENCEARRGIPSTSITERIMRVPTKDEALSRVIRAHEMMHAKVSPAGDWEQWLKRGIASEASLCAVEEARVNLLCKRAGFDVEQYLADGGETADGERIVATDDWAGAVRMAVTTAGTAGNKLFLNGVRRHNRLWGKALLSISKRTIKELGKITNSYLADTSIEPSIKLAPRGFVHTERLAEWVDRLAGMDSPQEKQESEKDDSSSDEGDSEDASQVTARAHSNIGVTESADDVLEKIKTITPSSPSRDVPHWGELVVEKMSMPKLTNGNIGRKRIASNIGRSPRRLHRLATDPEKRVFDKVKRGIGGVVIIDGSGSMSLSHDQVRRIVEASPGCTVAVYTDRNCRDETNFWILAEKGRMTDELPSIGHGNGVDFPAIEWGVKHRQNSRSPVIWVTDGGVCGPNQGYSDILAMQCIEYCKKNRIIVTEDVEDSIAMLKSLQTKRTVRRTWNMMFHHTFQKKMGYELVNDDVQ